MAAPKPEYSVVHFVSPEEWGKWLTTSWNTESGIWLKFSKKGSGIASVTYPEAVEVALCFGWIDGQAKSLDDTFYLQKFTPRTKRSMWSKINREKVERLAKEGRIRTGGAAAIEAAKADGRWDAAYDASSTMVIPEDFLKRLQKDKKAEAFYNTLNKANLFAIGYRLQTARKSETREKRLAMILEMLRQEKKFH